MRIVCIGGGPAGLTFALLMKKLDPRHEITVVERNRGKRIELPATTAADGTVCFRTQSFAPQGVPDGARERITIFEVSNGTGAGPLEIHTYDLGARGMFVAGVIRPEP